ncbi:MAG: choice-of-anchor Q domain-containing protein [Verrucomicrobiota bacterium]
MNTNDDGGPGSLRQAIQEACALGAPDISFGVTGVITLTNGALLITNNLAIAGPGAANLAISGNFSGSVFEISSNATVSISGVTICDGYGAPGGGIYNQGRLTLSYCTLTNNSGGYGGDGTDGTYQGFPGGWGPGADQNGGAGGPGGDGGGVYNANIFQAIGCTFSGNYAGEGGGGGNVMGGFEGQYGNGGPGGNGGNGGGLYNSGTMTLTNCTFSGNGGGIGGYGGNSYEGPGGFGGTGGNGGGIYNSGTLELAACTLSANSAGDGGGGNNGNASGSGGNGGGLYNSGTMTLTNCTLCGNGGGIGGYGGWSFGDEGFGGFGGIGGNGGGIYNSGGLELVACTLSANSAGYGGGPSIDNADGYAGVGGGICNVASNTSAKLLETLVALNTVEPANATGFGGVGPDLAGPFTSLGYNLIGQTNGSTGFTHGVNADLAGTTANPLDPLLGPLASNGGSTPTMALLHGSPALDAGDAALHGPPYNLTTDQRGFPRKAGWQVDIGAFEFQGTATPPVLVSLPASAAGAFQFAFANTSGATFTVLTGTNLSATASDWTVIGQALEVAPGQFQFTDPQTTNYPNRFYRVSSP